MSLSECECRFLCLWLFVAIYVAGSVDSCLRVGAVSPLSCSGLHAYSSSARLRPANSRRHCQTSSSASTSTSSPSSCLLLSSFWMYVLTSPLSRAPPPNPPTHPPPPPPPPPPPSLRRVVSACPEIFLLRPCPAVVCVAAGSHASCVCRRVQAARVCRVCSCASAAGLRGTALIHDAIRRYALPLLMACFTSSALCKRSRIVELCECRRTRRRLCCANAHLPHRRMRRDGLAALSSRAKSAARPPVWRPCSWHRRCNGMRSLAVVLPMTLHAVRS